MDTFESRFYVGKVSGVGCKCTLCSLALRLCSDKPDLITFGAEENFDPLIIIVRCIAVILLVLLFLLLPLGA
jgi:hypothetical protein